MKEKIRAFILKYPLWTGILGGFLICFAFFGIISGINSKEINSFKNADQILKEDYLRMAVNDYAFTKNADRARWRYEQLEQEAPSLMSLLKKDNLSDPLALLQFSQIVGDSTLIVDEPSSGLVVDPNIDPKQIEEKSSGGIPLIGKIVILLGVLILIGAVSIYFMSDKSDPIKKAISNFIGKFKGKKPFARNKKEDNAFDPGNEVQRYPEGYEKTNAASAVSPKTDLMIEKEFQITDIGDDEDPFSSDNPDQNVDQFDTPEFLRNSRRVTPISLDLTEPSDDSTDDTISLDEPETQKDPFADEEYDEDAQVLDKQSDLWMNDDGYDETDDLTIDEDEEQDLAEILTDDHSEPTKPNLEITIPEPEHLPDEKDPVLPEQPANVSFDDKSIAVSPDENELIALSKKDEKFTKTEPLIHYQTIYKLGDDFFDETFSLDDSEDKFIGECGIGIAETINNSEPKAVTAFEIWLFDRDDVQTPTHFLLSDFAFSNAEMLERLKNKGRFDLIELNREYEVRGQSLKMIVVIKEMEYGSESSNKQSYFNKVTFDVRVWQI